MIARLLFSLLVASVLVLTAACVGGKGDSPAETLSTVEVQSGYAEVAGGRLYYEVAGSGDALVLIHGNEGDRRHWDHQFDALARDFRVVRYDVRGYGKSSLPVEGEPYTGSEDLATLLDQLGIPKAHIGGWSMGSGIAVDFVLAYPERAMSLISVGPWVVGYSSPAVQSLLSDFAAVAVAHAEGGPSAAVEAWNQAPFWVPTVRDSTAGAEFTRIAADYSWWAFSHSTPERFFEPNAPQHIAEIQVPTLILTAEHDVPACLEIADLLDQKVPDSRKIVMAGTGHLLQMEKPREFNQHVIDFLGSVGGG
jgi:pimeloyl-ACP methyl ester carboxylesterase